MHIELSQFTEQGRLQVFAHDSSLVRAPVARRVGRGEPHPHCETNAARAVSFINGEWRKAERILHNLSIAIMIWLNPKQCVADRSLRNHGKVKVDQ